MNNKETIKIFKVLGNERRFLIMKHLLKERELTVGKISELINLSFKSVSRHLSILMNANLVEVRQVSINRFYSPNMKYFNEFINFFKN